METTKKVQESQEMQATPEFKKRERLKKLLYGVGIVIFLVMAFFYYRSSSYTGTPHIVQLSGMSLEPGKTTVQEMIDNGFEISDKIAMASGQVYDTSTSMNSKSYYDSLLLIKDGKEYATIAVYNEDLGQKALAECKLREIRVSDFNEDYENATLDGVKLPQLTVEFLIKNNGEPYDSYPFIETTITQWEDVHYTITLEVNADGTVHAFTSKYE